MMTRHDTLYMSGFFVVYTDKKVNGNISAYQVDFLKREGGKWKKEFTLFPSVNHNERMGDVYNPDTRHFFTRDYYTYISYVSPFPDYIVIKAIMNPYINILWAGAIIMTIGLIYAFIRRLRRGLPTNSSSLEEEEIPEA